MSRICSSVGMIRREVEVYTVVNVEAQIWVSMYLDGEKGG